MSLLALSFAGFALASPVERGPSPPPSAAAVRPPPPDLDPERRKAYLDYSIQRSLERADKGYRTALISGGIWLGSQALTAYAWNSGNDGLLVVGGLGTFGGAISTFVGMGVQAGAVNRGARLLDYSGATVDRANGRAAWWLFGGSFVPALVSSAATGGDIGSRSTGAAVLTTGLQLAAMGGSIATGRLQYKRNLATYELGDTAARRRRAVALRVVPTGRGAALTGTF